MLLQLSKLSVIIGASLVVFNTAVSAGQTKRVNIASNGAEAETQNGMSYGNSMKFSAISANGRYVVFQSSANNLVPGDVNKSVDIFVHDLLTHTTERVNLTSKGEQIESEDWSNMSFSISADGRYVTFDSKSSKLVAGDTNYSSDIFLHDRKTHVTERISIGENRQQSNRDSSYPSISADGRYVAFSSNSDNLVSAGTGPNIFIFDRQTRKTQRVKGTTTTYINNKPIISADGRYVAFESYEPLVVGDTNEITDLFVYDIVSTKFERVNVSSNGQQAKPKPVFFTRPLSEFGATFSANGRYITFASDASNLVQGDSNDTTDVFVHDRVTHKTERVSVSTQGKQGYGSSGSYGPSISADGRYVSFASDMPSLVAMDTNATSDIFVHDRLTHKTERVNLGLNESEAEKYTYSGSWDTSLSADGRYVTFISDASNLVANDTNNQLDIFVRDTLLDTAHKADLTVVARQKPLSLQPGSTGSYVYTITNNGKDTVPDVSLTHLVSDANASSVKPSQGKCSFTRVETVCHLGGLASGKKITVNVTVKAKNKEFSQQLTVGGAPVDTVPSNNQILVVTPVK